MSEELDVTVGLSPSAVERLLQRLGLGPNVTFEAGSNPQFHIHVTGEALMSNGGNKYVVGQAGAVGFGSGAAVNHGEVSGSVSLTQDSEISQNDFKAEIGRALQALSADFVDLKSTTYDALHQFLRAAANLKVDGQRLSDVQAMVEDLWVRDAAAQCKQIESDTLAIFKVLKDSGILSVVMKHFLPAA